MSAPEKLGLVLTEGGAGVEVELGYHYALIQEQEILAFMIKHEKTTESVLQ